MTTGPVIVKPDAADARARVRIVAIFAGLVAAVLIAYANTFRAPFIFDDIRSIVENPTLGNLVTSLQPPEDRALSGRPVTNLSFAINRLISGNAVWSYHALNILIHASAALVLLGLVRRTLARAQPSRSSIEQQLIAGLVALLWALQPLETAAVTFVVQRSESLVSLLYLTTLYAFARAAEARRPAPWLVFSVLACVAGMGAKEVMVSAPLLVLLYDRTFVSRTFAAAVAARRGYYGALALSWLILAAEVASGHGRTDTSAFGTAISAWSYLVTQGFAIPHYLRLAVWPAGLVFDYGYSPVPLDGVVALKLVGLAVLFAGTIWALIRRSTWGFLSGCFFAILAPSSSVVPLTLQTIGEHRLYLTSAVPLVLIVTVVWRLLGRRTLPIALAVAIGLGTLTIRRNAEYQSAEMLWSTNVVRQPANARGWANLAHAYADAGRWTDAIAAARKQLEIDPAYFLDAHAILGRSLEGLGRMTEAIAELKLAVQQEPGNEDVRIHYARALASTHRLQEAADQYRIILQRDPDSATAHGNLANLLVRMGASAEAWGHYEMAARLRPADAQIQANWGASLLETDHAAEAVNHFRAALQVEPRAGTARLGLAGALAQAGQIESATQEYRRLLETNTETAAAHLGLGDLDARAGRVTDAIAEYQAAVQQDPRMPAAQHNLAILLMESGRTTEALACFERTLQLLPDSAPVHQEYALALAQVGRTADAITHARRALALDPQLTEVRELLTQLQGR